MKNKQTNKKPRVFISRTFLDFADQAGICVNEYVLQKVRVKDKAPHFILKMGKKISMLLIHRHTTDSNCV